MRKSAAALLLVASALPVLAQDAPPAPPDIAFADIETVQIDAKPGPPLWRVARGNSEVWIFGMPQDMPKALAWNREPLAELIDGARIMLGEPRAKIDVLAIGWLFISNASAIQQSLPRGMTLEPILPRDTREQFVRIYTEAGRDAKRYERDTPFGAASRLRRDMQEKLALDHSRSVLEEAIQKLAAEKKVPFEPAARFDILPLIEEQINVPLNIQAVCMAGQLNRIAHMSGHAAAMAEAWAVGDVKGIKAHFVEAGRSAHCDAAMPISKVTIDKDQGYVEAIEAALNQPGRTVVVVPGMGSLLEKGGILEQLQARKLVIEGPEG